MDKIEPIQISEMSLNVSDIRKLNEMVRLGGVAGLRFQQKETSTDFFNEITKEVGECFKWKTEFGDGFFREHREDCSAIEHLPVTGAETLLIPWHISGIHEREAHAGVFWRMDKFSAPAGSGKTGFFDCEYLCEIISPKWKELLSSARIVHLSGEHTEPRNAIEINPLTGNETIRIRIDSDRHEERLFSVDGREPTEKEQSIFRQISIWAFFNAYSNTGQQKFWEWEEGDIVVVDLFRMAYSVFGGFQIGQRVAVGRWALYG